MTATRSSHPSREQLAAFVAGKLERDEQSRVETHVAECEACCEVLRELPGETVLHRLRPPAAHDPLAETQAIEEATPPDARPRPGTVPAELAEHPRYRLLKQLGAGGMGVVYQAEHRLMERTVALKIVNRQFVKNRQAIERFRREVKAAAQLSHRNIVTAFDAEQAGDTHFLVMEFVEGECLTEIVRRHGKLPIVHACNYTMQAAKGLQHASECGMVHRDIKPQNLMRTPQGSIKILDFGLARLTSDLGSERLTAAKTALGTVDFIAPEQIQDSRHVDVRADIYSLGSTLYFLLAGHVPFPSRSPMDKVMGHLQQEPQSLLELRPDIPSEVVEIVERMMAKDPAHRYQTPAEVVQALRPFATTESASSEPSQMEIVAPVPPPVSEPQPVRESAPAKPITDDPPASPTNPTREAKPRAARTSKSRPRELLQNGTRWRFLLWIGLVLLVLAVGWQLRPSVPNGDGLPDNGSTPPNPVSRSAIELNVEWTEMIPHIDPALDAVAGEWTTRAEELVVGAAPSARLILPCEIPDEYDLEVAFTREAGEHSIAIFFVAGAGQATFEIDAWSEHLAGIQNIDGQTLQNHSAAVANRALQNGRRYTALVQVRRGRVDVYFDGEPLTAYTGDGSNLSVLELWSLPGTRMLGVGAYESHTTFHQIRLRRPGG